MKVKVYYQFSVIYYYFNKNYLNQSISKLYLNFSLQNALIETYSLYFMKFDYIKIRQMGNYELKMQ